jgi:hypothetical protein
MSYIILRGHWCNNNMLNVYAVAEDKIDDVKDRVYKELEYVRVFHKFSKYNMNNYLGDFSDRVGRKVFSSQLLGIRVYTKLAMIMESE